MNIIVAVSQNGVIGNNNKIPWRLKKDLKFFKETTINKTVIMGRKTFESIGKPLINRKNIILTKNKNFKADGCEIIHSLNNIYEKDCFILGGGQIYALALPFTNTIYMTTVFATILGNTYFPTLNYSQWKRELIAEYTKDKDNEYNFKIEKLTRINTQ